MADAMRRHASGFVLLPCGELQEARAVPIATSPQQTVRCDFWAASGQSRVHANSLIEVAPDGSYRMEIEMQGRQPAVRIGGPTDPAGDVLRWLRAQLFPEETGIPDDSTVTISASLVR